MPVLSVKAVAAAAGKDPKTLRLWCERGLVPGAERAANHRHWKIRGKNAQTVAAEAHRRAAGFSRRRLSKDEYGLQRIERATKKINRHFEKLERNALQTRKGQTATKYLSIISAALLDKSKDELEMLGLDESAVRDLAWLPLQGPALRATMTGALCVWIIEGRNGSRAAAARCAGVGRRSFMRVFGRYWLPACDLVAEVTEQRPEVVTGWQRKGKDKRTGKDIGERVPVVLPPDATDDEKRAWTGAVRSAKQLPED